VVSRLGGARPILSKAVTDGRIKIVGATYDLAIGKVDFDMGAA